MGKQVREVKGTRTIQTDMPSGATTPQKHELLLQTHCMIRATVLTLSLPDVTFQLYELLIICG